jgi:hypothetical protein
MARQHGNAERADPLSHDVGDADRADVVHAGARSESADGDARCAAVRTSIELQDPSRCTIPAAHHARCDPECGSLIQTGADVHIGP